MVHLKNDGNSNSKFVWSDLFQGLDFPCEQLQGCLCGMLKSSPQKDFNQTKRFGFQGSNSPWKISMHRPVGPPKSSRQLSWMKVFWTHEKRRRSQPAQPLLKKDPFQDPAVYTPDTSNQNTGCCNYHRLSLQSWVMPYYNWGDER